MEEVEEPICEELYLQEDKKELSFSSIELAEQEATSDGPAISRTNAKPVRKASSKSQESKDADGFDDQFSYFFYKIAGADERLDAFELQRVMGMIFRSFFPKNSDFSLEACRAMISSMDHHRLGKLNYTQFKELWQKLMKWKHTFEVSDVNHDSMIDFSELCTGMNKLGLQLDDTTIQVLMNRFQNHSKLIELDDFLQICCKSIAARKSYQTVVKDGNAPLDTFMLHIIYNKGAAFIGLHIPLHRQRDIPSLVLFTRDEGGVKISLMTRKALLANVMNN